MSSLANLLKGQAAILTGANSGIGEASARALTAAGAVVVVNYVVQPQAQKVVDDIVAAGGRAVPIQADVSDWRSSGPRSRPLERSISWSTTRAFSATRRSPR